LEVLSDTLPDFITGRIKFIIEYKSSSYERL